VPRPPLADPGQEPVPQTGWWGWGLRLVRNEPGRRRRRRTVHVHARAFQKAPPDLACADGGDQFTVMGGGTADFPHPAANRQQGSGPVAHFGQTRTLDLSSKPGGIRSSVRGRNLVKVRAQCRIQPTYFRSNRLTVIHAMKGIGLRSGPRQNLRYGRFLQVQILKGCQDGIPHGLPGMDAAPISRSRRHSQGQKHKGGKDRTHGWQA